MNHADDRDFILLDYELGYFSSIVHLLKKVKKDKSLIIPLTFLISHYIELWIKSLAFFYGLTYTDFDFRSLNIEGHNLKKLILNESQIEEFANNGVRKDKVDEVMELLEYFNKYTRNNTDLSIAMRYPFSPQNNDFTISNNFYEYKNININDYINKAKRLLQLTADISCKFFDSEYIRFEERLKNIGMHLQRLKQED